MTKKDSFWLKIIYIFSAILTLAVAFLILRPRPEGLNNVIDVSGLPKVNVLFNGLTFIFLLMAFYFIRQKQFTKHRNMMLSAFASSTAFLVSYVIYHWFKSGPKLYEGDFTTLYYIILFSHILLATVIIPMALITLYRGWNNQLTKHKYIAKITLPIWVYVSITGVVIYVMLY
jgi:putative membrane protein